MDNSMLLPEQINVDVVHFCNYRCTYCHFFSRELSNNLRRVKAAKFYLRNRDFEKELDAILPHYPAESSGPVFAFTGMGEPCLNPEFDDILRTCARRNARFNVLTNYSYATTRYIEPMIDCGVDIIHTDLDAGNKESYEAICPGAHFETTIANLESTMEYIARTNAPSLLNVNFIVTRRNMGELRQFIDLMYNCGVKIVTLKFGAALEFKQYDIFFREFHEQMQLVQAIQEARDYGRSQGLVCHSHDYLRYIIGENTTPLREVLATPRPCPGAVKSLWLNFIPMESEESLALGNVGMYCHLRQDEKFRWFGNVLHDDFIDIVHHPVRVDLIQGMQENRHNSICKNCEYQYFKMVDILQERLSKAEHFLAEAQANLARGNAAAAEESCRKALHYDPNHRDALSLLDTLHESAACGEAIANVPGACL